MNRLSFFLFTVIFSSLAIHAQTNSKKPFKECSAPLARQLVEQQAIESKSVEETDKRVNILLRVADFLWIGDEETARKYFAEAFQIAQERFREKGIEKNESSGFIKYQPDYRFSVISAVAKRDAEWAKKLSESVLKEFDEDKEKDKRRDHEKNREVNEIIRVAAQTAKDNPQLALSLARRAMRYPLGSDWTFALYEMAGNNQPLADQIYGELLANYADAEFYRLLYLSPYPFSRNRVFGAESNTLWTSVPEGFSPNQNLKRQFLTTALRRALRLTPENTGESLQTSTPESAIALFALEELAPIVGQQFPDLAQTFAQAKIHLDSIVAADARQKAKEQSDYGERANRPFDRKLEDLEKDEAEGKLSDFQIYLLVNAAKTDEDFQKAESWIDKMRDETAREGTLNYLFFKRSQFAAKEKRFDDARKHALKVPKIEHRAVLFFDIAEAKLKEPLTKLESLDTLLEVYQTALKAPDTVEKAQVLLGTAFMYEKIDHYSALNALADAIKTANKLENPNLFSNSVSQQIRGKNFSAYSFYTVPGFDVTETFHELSKKDFQGALNNSTSFFDKYAKTLAVLATVKDCEKNQPPAKQKAKTK